MGEVRLFTGNLSDDSGLKQQVAFRWVPGRNATFEREPYDPIRGPGRPGSYEYDPTPKQKSHTWKHPKFIQSLIAGVAVTFGLAALIGMVLQKRR